MAMVKISRDGVKKSLHIKEKGIVYILKMMLGDREDPTVVYKIGVTTRKIEERVLELVVSHFKIHRWFPQVVPRKFTRTTCYYEIEKELHDLYEGYRYNASEKIDGYTELFVGIDEEELISKYNEIMDKYKDKKTPRPRSGKIRVEDVPEIYVNDICDYEV